MFAPLIFQGDFLKMARLILSKPLLQIYQRGEHISHGLMMKPCEIHFQTWSSSPACLCYSFRTPGCFLHLVRLHHVLLLSCWCLLPEWCSNAKPCPTLLDVTDNFTMEESSPRIGTPYLRVPGISEEHVQPRHTWTQGSVTVDNNAAEAVG